MRANTLMQAGLLGGLAVVAGMAVAAAPDAVTSEAVLDLGAVSGEGTGKVSLASFSWGLSQGPSKRTSSGPAPSSPCPASSDAGRWKAPELNSTSDRAAQAPLPPGPGCVVMVWSKKSYDMYSANASDRAAGRASGQRKGWDGCVKGSGIAHARLSDARSIYMLKDVTVEECTADGMVLSFKSVDRPAPQAAVPQRPGPRPTVSGSD